MQVKREKRCIVMGAGELAVTKLEGFDAKKDTVIAVDGGLGHCVALGIKPDMIIGDFDSVDKGLAASIEETERRFPDKILRLTPEKDDTDMLAALKWGLARDFHTFLIYAGMGGRLDHTLANIQCLLFLKNNGAEGYLLEDKCCIMAASGETKQFSASLFGRLSLFSLEKESVVSITNMKYPLSSYTVTNDFPIGISNEFLPGKEGAVTVHSGAVAILISLD